MGLKELAKKLVKKVTADVTADETADDDIKKSHDVVSAVEEQVEHQLEREIIKTQRKKTAGKGKPTPPSAGRKFGPQIMRREGPVEIPDLITVKEFAEKTGIPAAKVIGELMKNGILANINLPIDFETAQIIASDLKVEIKRKRTEASVQDISSGNLEVLLKEDDAAMLLPRPPIVCVMGHVDHGKTKLLDAIRTTNVVAQEHGGITQHIGAYQVEKNGKKITFLDTPGHEAFTAMRARGAQVTDIAILVVAADEGVKPQTLEALNHAKDAGVTIIVAINKIDKEGANIDRVKAELAEHGLQPEDWGGKVVMVPLSALTGENIPTLLEMILLTAEMENFRANPNREAVGVVVESNLNPSFGPVATVLIKSGTLKIMDNIVIGGSSGRVKVMKNEHGKNLESAGPSTPVQIAGLKEIPLSGDILQGVKDEETARRKALEIHSLRDLQKSVHSLGGLSGILQQIKSGALKTVKVVLKADAKGSLEAIQNVLSKIEHPEVAIKVIHTGIGAITESDVMMAAASQGIVVGFHTPVSAQVKKMAEREGVEIAIYTIIYKLADDLKALLSGLLEPEVIETVLGRAQVLQIFYSKRKEMIVGCRVTSGKLQNKAQIRVFRGEEQIGSGFITSLKRTDQNVEEVSEGYECGVKYEGDVKVEPSDLLEAFKVERRKRELA